MKLSTQSLALFVCSIIVGCGAEEPLEDSATVSPRETVDGPQANGGTPGHANQPAKSERDPSDDELVQEDVRKMVNAVYQADVATALKYTHPTIIDMMGGVSRAEAALESAFSQFQSLNMKLESLTFPEPPVFLETGETRFAIVPTKSIISANGQRVESLNFQFGIQKKGTTVWKYVEGSRINNDNVRLLFPDFPSDYEFPETYRKKL